MNVIVPSTKKAWLPLAAAGLLAVLALGLWISDRDLPGSARGEVPAPPVDIPEAIIDQVPWKVRAFPAGVTRPLTKAQKKAIGKNKVSAGEPVTQVVDALMFEPAALGALRGKVATAGAARALARSKLVPKGIEEVKVIRRVARVGIDVAGTKRAAAKVRVGFKGRLDGKAVRLNLSGAFWLERYSNGWKIVAFEGESRPYTSPQKAKKAQKQKKAGGKRS